jgi:hypothetical protein
VRWLLGVVLDGARRAAVGVAFAQHRVDGGAQALAVAGLERLFFVGGRVFRVVRDLVALFLQFLDAGLQLRDGSRDVGQLDDIGVRLEGLLAQFGQRVRNALSSLRYSGNSASTRADTEMSAFSMSIPAGAVKVRTIGRKAQVASSGASSVSV